MHLNDDASLVGFGAEVVGFGAELVGFGAELKHLLPGIPCFVNFNLVQVYVSIKLY